MSADDARAYPRRYASRAMGIAPIQKFTTGLDFAASPAAGATVSYCPNRTAVAWHEIGHGMGDNLEVDPVAARMAGEHLDTHATDFLAGHAAAHERIAAAESGFIGESAAALAELMEHWKDESAAHHRELSEHADKFRTAADKYETTDTGAGATIDASVADLAQRMGRGM